MLLKKKKKKPTLIKLNSSVLSLVWVGKTNDFFKLRFPFGYLENVGKENQRMSI